MKTALKAIVIALAACAPAAQAQVKPDAGALLKQIEQGRAPKLPEKSTLELAPLPPPLVALPGPTATITSIVFEGNHLLSAAQLAEAVAPFLNKPLSFNELQNAAIAAATAYRAAGWIVRAYLPAQEVKDGKLLIQIVEAKFGGVRIDEKSKPRMSQARLAAIVEAAQPKGQPVSAAALDRAMLMLEDIPGLNATGNLAQGEQERETELVVSMADGPYVKGSVSFDNTGSPATGRAHYNGAAAMSNAFAYGEDLSSMVLHSSGSDYLRVAGTMPVGVEGLRVGVNSTYLRYKLVTAAFAALDIKGSSASFGLDANYPLLRTRTENLYLAATYDHKTFDNLAAGATTTKYKLDTASLTLNGNRFDSWGGGGAVTGSLGLAFGNVNLDGSPNQKADADTVKVQGSFSKFKYAINRTQMISEALSAYAALSGQIGSKNLDSSERMFLGGMSGVRAYPAGEAGGTDGQMLNVELRQRLPGALSLTGFFDWGHVTVNRDNDFVGAAVHNSLSIKGAGLALAWQSAAGIGLKATWARRMGSNPNPGPDGNDSDGTLVKNRFWLTAAVPF